MYRSVLAQGDIQVHIVQACCCSGEFRILVRSDGASSEENVHELKRGVECGIPSCSYSGVIVVVIKNIVREVSIDGGCSFRDDGDNLHVLSQFAGLS